MAVVGMTARGGQNPSSSRATRDRRWCYYRVGALGFSACPPFRSQLRCTLNLYVNYLNPQCILIDSPRNQLRPATAIDGRRAQCIVVDNVYRWIACTSYCGQQWPSMDTFADLLWTMCIDWQYPQSIATTIGYCCQAFQFYRCRLISIDRSTVSCSRQWTSVDFPRRPLSRQ